MKNGPLSRADKLAKRLLARAVLGLAGPCPFVPAWDGPMRHVIVLAQEKLGDAMLLSPLFRLLKRNRPGVRIHVVVYGSSAAFFRYDPFVDDVLHGKRNYLRFFRDVRRIDADLLYSPKDHASFTFLYQSRLIPARVRVGIAHPQHQGFFHHLLAVDFHRHVALKNCALLDFLGIPYAEEECRPVIPDGPVSPDIERFAAAIEPGTIGINLSAGEPSREWPLDRWIALLDQVRRPAVVLSMPARREDKARLEAASRWAKPSPATASIFEVGALVKRLGLLVTPDTSLIHVASALQIPVVGLYRVDPVHLGRFAPFRVPHRQVLSETSLVAEIPVHAVLSAVRELTVLGEVT
jgi:heptosyltransferase III